MPPKKSTLTQNSLDGSGSNKSTKLFWTDEEFSKFVEICIQGTYEGHRKRNGWGDTGWNWVINKMKIEGFERIQDQLKHKQDWMQKQWRIWQKLIGQETGLGWDYDWGTIAASSESQEDKINVSKIFDKYYIFL